MDYLNISTDSRAVTTGDDEETRAATERAKRLDTVLKAKGLSNRSVSLRVGVGHSHISQVIQGKIRDPGIAFWQGVARETGASLAYIFDGTLPMFEPKADPESLKYPSRAGVLLLTQGLPPELADKIVGDMLADNQHATDPGVIYWANLFMALHAKHHQ